MFEISKEVISTDVLVIGGGASGLIAALEAKNGGLDVAIISKSRVGRSGNTIVSGSAMAVLIPEHDSGDTYELFYEDIIKSGKGINDSKLVDLFVKRSSKIIDKLTGYGVVFRKVDNRFLKKRPPGHSCPRSVPTDYRGFSYLTRGLSLTLPLLNRVKTSGIKIIEGTPVVKLLVTDNRICGAIAIDKKREKVLIFRTGIIILASGGGGRIFSRSNNTRDITGDSYSLAYDAGAVLRDMEFVQFYPTMMYSPIKMPISNPLFGDGAVLRNSHRERFMENYDKSGDMATRDIMARAIYTEIMNGRDYNGSVFVDCSTIPENTLKSKYAEFCEYLNRAGIDPLKDLIPVSPGTHFFMGGLVINQEGESTIQGLLACGECVGGIHGANRLSGNALSETVVFGIIAGRTAVKIAETQSVPSLPLVEIESFREGSICLTELKCNLQEIMWKYVSLIRNRESLEKARSRIEEILNLLNYAEIKNIHDLISFYELKNMITTSRLIVEGSILRTESRGAHYRSDYPDINNRNFKGNYFYQNIKGDLNIKFKPV